MEVKKKVPASGSKQIVDEAFIDDVCSWMYSFVSEVGIVGQEKMHLQQLNLPITQSVGVIEGVRTATNHFVNHSFLNVLRRQENFLCRFTQLSHTSQPNRTSPQ
jgi:hypothetical protein